MSAFWSQASNSSCIQPPIVLWFHSVSCAEIAVDCEGRFPHAAGELADHVLLVGEMGIEGGARRSRRLGDVVDRRAARAVLDEQLARRVDQPLAGEIALLAAERDGFCLSSSSLQLAR